MIYRIDFDRESYSCIYVDEDELLEKMDDLIYPEGEPIEGWVQPDGEFYDGLDKDRVLEHTNISSWVRNLTFSEDLYNLVKDKLSKYAEFLPVTVDGSTWFVMNVTHYANDNIVDEANSEKRMSGGIEMGINKLAFHGDKLNESLLFRTHFDSGLGQFCTDEFKDLMESIGGEGIIFSKNLT